MIVNIIVFVNFVKNSECWNGATRDDRIVVAPLAVRFPAGAFKGPEPALDTGRSLRMEHGPRALPQDDTAPALATRSAPD